MMNKIKIAVFIVCSLPLIVYLWVATTGGFSPDPGKTLIRYFAHTALSLLLVVLSLPLWARWHPTRQAKKLSRMLGLFCFFYVSLHFLSYLAFVTGFSWQVLVKDLTKRPYAYVGMFAFTILLAMAFTSTQGWQRLLRHNWKRLHRLVYLALLLAVVHVTWVARSDYIWAVVYGTLGTILLAGRFYVHKISNKE